MVRWTRWFLSACLALPALAAPSGQNRVALVIGNDSYKHVTALKNAKMDARAIAKEMERAGFTVNLRLDVDEKGMKDAIRTFKGQVAGGDVAVFYFSGHGVQLGGANYLLPVDIRGESEDQIKDEAVALQRILDDLQEQKARFSLAIVDACRNNPFQHGGRALGGRGLAVTSAATGQMVLFSAGAGQQALDTLGPHDKNPNGLFTRVLLKEMDRPGVPVDKVLRNVRDEVVKLSQAAGQEQVPALYDQALGEFYFFPSRNEAMPAPVAAPEAAPASSGLGAPPVASALLGGLQVAVNVPDAQVYLNGNLVGTASPAKALNLRDLPVGSASVRVEAPGYAARTQSFDILEGQWTQAKVVLAKPGEAPAAPTKTIWSKLNPTTWIGGAKPDPGTDGTAVSEAAMKGDVDKLKALVGGGAGVSNVDKWGWTPLHWAVYYNKMGAVNYLLQNGADANARVAKSYRSIKPGSTALMVAAYYGNEDAITALMKHRADPSIPDGDGKTPADLATQYRFEKCAALLKGK